MTIVESGEGAQSKSAVTALLPNGQICPMFDPPEVKSTYLSNFGELDGWIYKCGGNNIGGGRIGKQFAQIGATTDNKNRSLFISSLLQPSVSS